MVVASYPLRRLCRNHPVHPGKNAPAPIQNFARDLRFLLNVRVTVYSLPPLIRRQYSPVGSGLISSTNEAFTSADRLMRINPCPSSVSAATEIDPRISIERAFCTMHT